MARPRSEDKRRAILDATMRVCADRGIADAPTAAIARSAGIAEGSLFTYFKTKHDLMNELYTELRLEFSRAMTDFPHHADARARLRYVWDRLLDMGIERPERLKVLSQLRASGRLFKDDEQPTFVFIEVLNAIREVVRTGPLRTAPPEFLTLVLRGLAEETIEYIQAHPESKELCREMGFGMLWRGLAGR